MKRGEAVSDLLDQDLPDDVMESDRPALHVEVAKEGEIVKAPAKLSGPEMAELPIPFENGKRDVSILRKHGELEIQIPFLKASSQCLNQQAP